MQRLAELLRSLFSTTVIKELRTERGNYRNKRAEETSRANEFAWLAAWLVEHHGRTTKDYNSLPIEDLLAWRQAKGQA